MYSDSKQGEHERPRPETQTQTNAYKEILLDSKTTGAILFRHSSAQIRIISLRLTQYFQFKMAQQQPNKFLESMKQASQRFSSAVMDTGAKTMLKVSERVRMLC